MPKKVVDSTFEPAFLVLTLEKEIGEESSAKEEAPAWTNDNPKSHNFVYPSPSIKTFSGLRLAVQGEPEIKFGGDKKFKWPQTFVYLLSIHDVGGVECLETLEDGSGIELSLRNGEMFLRAKKHE